MISKEEWSTEDKNKLFAQFFYSDDHINKQQLSGLLYYNKGVAALENEQYVEAYKNFKKSYFLYPTNKSKYLVSITFASRFYKPVRWWMKTFTSLLKRYPFIDKNGMLGEMDAYILAAYTSRCFEKDKKEEGEKYFAIIKEMFINQPDLVKKSEMYLIPAFIEIYVYYVRHKKYKEPKAFLQLIEKYLAGNEEISRRIDRINTILDNQ